ncbi:MAG: hypothetical protein AAF654_12415 [Myxococcota bacterium]
MRAALILLLILTPHLSFAGPLGDMDRDLRGADRDDDSDDSKDSHDDDDYFDDGFDDDDADDSAFGEILVFAFIFGAEMSVARLEPDWSQYGGGVALRADGEALIPFLRVDGAALFLSADGTDVDGRFVSAEAGWGPLAVSGQLARLDDGEDTVDISYVHGLYRMSFGSAVEIGLGFGAGEFDIGDALSGFSFTTPFRVHPSRYWGLEFVPIWTDFTGASLEDYTIQALLGYDYASVTVGWRFLETRIDIGGGETERGTLIDGPTIGVSLRY